MKASILVVDDTPDNLRLLMGVLKQREYEIRVAHNGELALQSAKSFLPDLILLDIMMPEMNGYEVCKRLKADERTRNIPVIFLSALDEATDKVKGFKHGGLDYITKPFQVEEVLARVETHLALQNLQKALQEENSKRRQAEASLQKLNEHLEERITIRTAELEKTNKALKAEIHERRQTEQALQDGEQQYRFLVEHAVDGIGIIQEGKLVFVNDALTSLLGSSEQALLGKTPDEIFHSVFKSMPEAEAGTPAWQNHDFCIAEHGKELWIEERHSFMRWRGKPAMLVSMRDVSERKRKEQELSQEKMLLRRENARLRSTMKDRYKFHGIIGRSLAMQEVYELIGKASASEASIIIYGESGTGKDLVAQTIHHLSKRRRKAFVPVNCGSIQEPLFEREFFGHCKGAFTGATQAQPGFFDAAHQGTLFLDEIGELSLAMQVKLLRAIEGSGYTPVGSQKIKYADVRIIAATNRDLKELVKQGLMREDFFYRINVIAIEVPPLRERKEDIPLLIEHVLAQFSGAEQPPILPGRILESLYQRDWPGNIRQLQNVLQRYLTLGDLRAHDDIHEDRADETPHSVHMEKMELRDALGRFEKQFIQQVLKQSGGHRKNTAGSLGIPLRTLQRKLKKYRLTKGNDATNDT